MNVLHLPFTYLPDAHGGTEVYVAALCRFLSELGVRNEIAAPADTDSVYEHAGVRVHRFATHPQLSQDMMFGGGDPVAAEGFARVLDAVRPDVVHFHAFSPAVGVRCLHEVKKRGIKSVTTYHTPTTSCVRGTLLRWGTKVCDGEMRELRCGACFLQAHGLPKVAACGASLTSVVGWPVSRLPGLSNASRAVLGVWRLMKKRLSATREWWREVDRVIALCEWSRVLLQRNGVSADRIRKVRHGLPSQTIEAGQRGALSMSPIRLAFLGRADPTKGIDLVLDALKHRPDLPVAVDFYTLTSNEGDAATAPLVAAAKADGRIRVCAPVASTEVVTTLRNYHALLVPSRWLETGPLVVLEAFAAGIPVVGSRLGGIAEWVTHEQDGLLVNEPRAEAWATAIQRLVCEEGLLARLASGVTPPRSMLEVAKETLAIYRELLPAVS